MTSPDDRADNSARNAAIKTVNDALKSGRIVQADHDMRVSQLKTAQTMQDIDMAVRDLRAAPPMAPVTIAPVAATATGQQPSPSVIQDTSAQPWPLVNYGPGGAGGGTTNVATVAGKSGGRAIGGIVALIILISVVVPIAGAVIAFVSAKDSFPDFGSVGPSDDTTYLPGQPPGKNGVNVLTVDGYNDLVDAIRDKTAGGAGTPGGPFVFDAVLYPRYAVVEIPTGTNTRYQNFYWNGEDLQLEDIKGTTDDPQVDLSLVDPQKVVDCVTTVHDRMDSPTSWYAIIGDSFDSGAQISCYASNEFGESTYIIETLDGTITFDSDVTPAAPQ